MAKSSGIDPAKLSGVSYKVCLDAGKRPIRKAENTKDNLRLASELFPLSREPLVDLGQAAFLAKAGG